MSKRLFQVLDDMNINDDVNKTATCGCCFDMVSADTVKAGGVVKMGVPAEAITKIFLGEYKPMLVLLDMKEYERLKDLPVDDAEARAERYEKALNAILNTNHDNHERVILKVKSIANEALTTKQTTDDTANG